MDTLHDMNCPPKGQGRRGGLPWLGTYILERHGTLGPGKGKGASWDVENTHVDDIRTLTVRLGRGGGRIQFYVDMRDRRYPLLHTGGPAGDADGAMGALVGDGAHRLDHAWLPSGLMARWAGAINVDPGGRVAGHGSRGRGAMPESEAGGTGAGGRRRPAADPHGDGKMATRGQKKKPDAHAEGRIPGTGRFCIRRGQSIRDYLHIVEGCKDEYAGIVARAERRRMGLTRRGGSRAYGGGPIEIMYPRVGGLGRLIDSMFGATRPFRLSGIKIRRDSDYGVPAVDLHGGSPIDFEIAPTFMRVYTRRKSCGNTMLRIFANLQARHCAGARCEELETLA